MDLIFHAASHSTSCVFPCDLMNYASHFRGKMRAMRGAQEGPTNRKEPVQSQAADSDNARADTNQSTIKSGLGSRDTAATRTGTNGSSEGIPMSQGNSGEERASVSPAGTSPPSTISRPPAILSPSEESNARLREPLLED